MIQPLVAGLIVHDGTVTDQAEARAPPDKDQAPDQRFHHVLAQARAGDAEAFATLYEERRGRLLRVAMLILGDAAASEDVVQESWINAWQAVGRATFRTPAQFGAWLGTIVGHAALSLRRRRRWDVSLDEVSPSASGGGVTIERDVADAVVEQQFVAALLAALRPADRRLLLLSLALSRRELLALLALEQARPLTMPVLRQRLSRATRAARDIAATLAGD